jgi:hypothetical protein
MIVLNVHQQPATHEVNCDGAVISALADRQSLDESEFGWWMNPVGLKRQRRTLKD